MIYPSKQKSVGNFFQVQLILSDNDCKSLGKSINPPCFIRLCESKSFLWLINMFLIQNQDFLLQGVSVI